MLTHAPPWSVDRPGFSLVIVLIVMSSLTVLAWSTWKQASMICDMVHAAQRHWWHHHVAQTCIHMVAQEVAFEFAYYTNVTKKHPMRYNVSALYYAYKAQSGGAFPYGKEDLELYAKVISQGDATLVVALKVLQGTVCCARAWRIIRLPSVTGDA